MGWIKGLGVSPLKSPICKLLFESSKLRPKCAATYMSRHKSETRTASTLRHGQRRLDIAQASNMMDIGIRKVYNEDHDMLRETCRKYFQNEVAPFHDEFDKAGEVSRECWLKAGEYGLLGINLAEEDGGLGADFLSATIMWEEQSYVNAWGPGFGLHNDIVMPYISHYGTPEQKQKFLPDMVAGRKIGAIAMTEPGAGSDLQGIRTNAKKDGDDWILNGSKVFITNGCMCDVVIVVAVTNPDAKSPAHGISLFLVEDGMPGFNKGKKLNKLGQKAQDTAELFFDDVRLPADALLGEASKGFYYLMQELPQERIMLAGMGQAHSEFMFEETRAYVRGRKAFGRTLAHLQTIQHKLAEMKTDICIARAFLDNCYQVHNDHGLDSQQASMAKYWTTDLQVKVATECLQMHGGWGYMMEYPIAKAFIDSRVQTIYGGANEIMKELIARAIVSDK